jgi:hypothetical protein
MILNEKCFCKLVQTSNESSLLSLPSSYRQAQATVLEAIPRLKAAKLATKRPDDYYAQMAKSDEHMKKVKYSLPLFTLLNKCFFLLFLDSRIFS